MTKRTYDNIRVLDPAAGLDFTGHLVIEDGLIAASGEGPASGDDAIDATGLVVVPGLFDLRAHFREPGFEDALYHLGIASLRRGWTRKALDAFRQVLRLDPHRLQYQESVRLLSVAKVSE